MSTLWNCSEYLSVYSIVCVGVARGINIVRARTYDMSKAKTYEQVVQETASQGVEGWDNVRVDKCRFLPKSEHYNIDVNVDSHVVKGEHDDYDSLSVFGHRLQSLMDLMRGLGLEIGMIRQFNNVDRDVKLPRGIEISFNSID